MVTTIPFLIVRVIQAEPLTPSIDSIVVFTNMLDLLRLIRIEFLFQLIDNEVNKQLASLTLFFLTLITVSTGILHFTENEFSHNNREDKPSEYYS